MRRRLCNFSKLPIWVVKLFGVECPFMWNRDPEKCSGYLARYDDRMKESEIEKEEEKSGPST